MTKPLIPLAVGLTLLAGCASIDAIKGLQTSVQTNGIVLVRAFTYASTPHVYLTWVRPDGSTIQNITRYQGSTAISVPKPSSGFFVEDKQPGLISGQRYSYKLQFAKNGTLAPDVDRFITPIDVNLARATLLEPSFAGNVNNLSPASTTPTFKWQQLAGGVPTDQVLSYMVTVAELDPTQLSAEQLSKFSPSTMNVAYSALIDPTKHTVGSNVEVAYGTKSDIAMGDDLKSALEQAGSSAGNNLSALKPKDSNVAPLTPGHKYAWTVAPIVFTKNQTAFALGDMSVPFFFQAQ